MKDQLTVTNILLAIAIVIGTANLYFTYNIEDNSLSRYDVESAASSAIGSCLKNYGYGDSQHLYTHC